MALRLSLSFTFILRKNIRRGAWYDSLAFYGVISASWTEARSRF